MPHCWCSLLLLSVSLAARAHGASPFFPIEEVKAGMHGTGKTVFQGDKIENFDVEILGVLANAGPKESVVLARLTGGPLEHTGVLQGMSGSPVYIDGRLLGAVAMAFPFSKDPIAAIRPIGDMIRSARGEESTRPPAPPVSAVTQEQPAAARSDTRMMNISTPLALGGFTARTMDAFGSQLRALGLDPRQGLSAGGSAMDAAVAAFGEPSRIQPGSMISVELMQGDLNVGADGTVTYVDGDQLYAFGHRFLAVGSTGLPFARSEVLTLLANVNSSFKISTPRELMGLISQDRDTAISGRFGQRANLLPLEIAVRRDGRAVDSYRMRMVNDPVLTPLLLQMAVFSTLDATERSGGAATIAVRGTIELEGKRAIHLNDAFAADAGALQLASLSTATPVSYILQSGFPSLRVKRISLDLDALEKKHALDISEVVLSKREVRAGDMVDLAVTFTAEDGSEQTRDVHYRLPSGSPVGPLYFTVADGTQTSMQELKFALSVQPRSPEQLLDLVERLRPNTKAYVRVWRPEPSFPTGVEELPAPPPSVALVMASTLGSGGVALNAIRNSKVAEMTLDGDGRMVSGSKTVQLEVKP